MDLNEFIVRPGRTVQLDRFPTDQTSEIRDKEEGKRLLERNVRELAEQQARLYTQDRNAVLVVLQAMDAAGKDSTIKHVMSGVNPQGVSITSFKAPTTRERDHDYLWRSVIALPERGMIGIHNRSYYEEVLIAKVHPTILQAQHLPPEALRGSVWRRRYEQINQFEKFLVENGTVVLKFFLHVSREEQRLRFLDRISMRDKQWKFSLQDVKERAYWKEYQSAYEDALTHTSTREAPWYIIPADRRWYMHLAVGRILVHTLKALQLEWPEVDERQRQDLEEGRRLLEGEGTAVGRAKAGKKSSRKKRGGKDD